jgi:hypothetical protein
MAPEAPSVSRQDVAQARHRLIVRVMTLLARLPRTGRGVSFFISRPNTQCRIYINS